MKKMIAILLSVVSIISVCSLPAYAASGEQHADAALKNDRETVITITGEENIRKYLESVGEVYPIYEKVTGEIWDDDVYYDDYIGDFTVYHAIGDDVRVYRA